MREDRERMEMLKELQELSFVALEFNLYLDTHPATRALAEYNFSRRRQAAKIAMNECTAD